MNVLGKPVISSSDCDRHVLSIHRPTTLEEQSTTLEMFETGIKVVT